MHNPRWTIIVILFNLFWLVQPSLSQSQPPDDTDRIQFLGNPLLADFPTNSAAHVRTILDMAVFNERIYLAYGDVFNNVGPIKVWYFNPVTGNFINEYTVDEEIIARFSIIEDSLYIPGGDPRDDWSFGNIYVNNTTGWRKLRTIPNGIHMNDIQEFDGKLFAALITVAPNPVVGMSDDRGETWEMLPITSSDPPGFEVTEVTELFSVGDTLFASAIVPVDAYLAQLRAGADAATRETNDFYVFNGSGFEDTDINFLPDIDPNIRNSVVYIYNDVRFSDRTFYLGAYLDNTRTVHSLGLFSIDTDLQTHSHRVPNDTTIGDMFAIDDVLYVITNEHIETGSPTITVFASCDGDNWDELARFSYGAFARSFMLYEGDFYFGMGSLVGKPSEHSGDVIRLTPNPPLTQCPSNAQ